MSQENVETVRAVIDAFNREDWEAALDYCAPDFELDFSRAVGMVRGVFKLDQIRAFLDEAFGQWEKVRWEIDELIEAEDEVVMLFVNTFRGRDGIEVQARPSAVWTFRDGSVVRACMYQERAEALQAAGLSE